MTSTQYERIEAEQIQPGDQVARARSHHFYPVAGISMGPISVTLQFSGGGIARPHRTAKWWRLRGESEQ